MMYGNVMGGYKLDNATNVLSLTDNISDSIMKV